MTPAGRHSWLERAVVLMLFAVPLTVPWTVAGVHIAIGAAMALAVADGVWRRRWPLRRTITDRAWVAWAIASTAAAVFAVPAATSWEPLKKLLLIPLVHVAARYLASDDRCRWALRLSVWTMGLTALVGAIWYLLRSEPASRFAGTSHYMTLAGQILLVLPAAAAATLASRGRLRGLHGASAAALFVALLLTFTRSAWLGAVAAGVAVLWRWRRRWTVLVPVVLAITFVVLPGRFRDRALSSFDLDHPTNQDRKRMWRAGVQMWRDHPWTGVGLGDLIPVYRDYAPADAERIHGHLHSNVVQVLASRGGLGLLAFVWLQVSIGRLVWRARSGDPELAAMLLGIWGSFVGFHVMGFFEWNFGDVEVTIALYWMLGVCAAVGVERQTERANAATVSGESRAAVRPPAR